MIRRAALLASAGLLGAFLLLVLAPHRSYSPGALSRGHQPISSQCATCHSAWRGVVNQRCIDCHGDYSAHNPHGGAKVSDPHDGVAPGFHLASASDKLSCLSCHTDHRGRNVNVSAEAGSNCTWCHKHPSIDDVTAHTKSQMQRPSGSTHVFKQAYSHAKHLELISQKDPSVKALNCRSCHVLEPRGNQVEVKFSLAWSGCAGSGCHDNAQDQYLQMPPEAGAAPQKIEYSNLASVRHMNAVFWHSPGHLRSACSECHAKIETSKRAGDPASRMVQRCFNCHAHQPLPKTTEAFNRAGFIEGLAQAGAPPERRVLGCNACHAFHIHGPSPDVDFPTKALVHPPKPLPGLQLTVYRPVITRHRDATTTVSLRRTRLQPWWMGLLAFLVIGFSAVGYVRTLPSAATLHKAKGNVAPQRVPEVPAIGDDYQSNVKRLYIVGEAAGTASINFAMRSGRLVVDAVASAIKYAPKTVDTQIYDVAIVGCGPAGIAATATAKSKGLKYVALEKMTAASTIVSYPRGKFVQATPIDLAEYGSFFLEGDNSKEALLKEWERVIAQAGLEINEREEVSAITSEGEIFTIKCTNNRVYKTRYVILAIGVRGTPRRLGAPGEAADRVFYNLIEPEEYKNKKILVVGGGNAGAEVTQALANPELGNTVSYSFRDPSLGTVTRENAEKVSALQQTGRVTIYPLSAVKEIKPGKVVLAPVKPNPGAAPPPPGIATIADSVELDNDVIFAMCGAELPTRFLKSIGIRMTKKGR